MSVGIASSGYAAGPPAIGAAGGGGALGFARTGGAGSAIAAGGAATLGAPTALDTAEALPFGVRAAESDTAGSWLDCSSRHQQTPAKTAPRTKSHLIRAARLPLVREVIVVVAVREPEGGAWSGAGRPGPAAAP
jgi:hypothetical protein